MEEKRIDPTPHTDLACERYRADTALPGVEYREEEIPGGKLARLSITSREGAESIGKPEGSYLTFSFPPLWEATDEQVEALSESLASLLLSFCTEVSGRKPASVLVAGLGNRFITSDAVGPESIRHMIATRHLHSEAPQIFEKYCDVEISLLAPGVLSQTGVESGDLIAGAVGCIHPELVIVIDALAARSFSRLATTIQLSNTGIRPGSGIGNARAAIDGERMGVPVIALGVPSVVDAATLVLDTLERAESEPSERLREVLREGASFFVSPRDADVVTERAATLIAGAVNRAFSTAFFAPSADPA